MINRIAVGPRAPGDGKRQGPRTAYVSLGAERQAPRQGLGEQVEKFIGDHPVAALAIGLAFGIVVGCLVKRR